MSTLLSFSVKFLSRDATDIFVQEHIIRTRHGSVSVSVYGDQDKPALITYPDLALNCKLNGFYGLCISRE